jgi:putative hydrolase
MIRTSGYDLTADYHTHTIFSHGSGTVAENARAAALRGLLEIAITDHGPALASGAGLRAAGAIEHVRAMVEQANQLPGGVRVLQGVEANVMDADGTLDLPDAVLRRLDIVLAGIHPAAGYVGWWGTVRGFATATLLPALAPRAARRRIADCTKGMAEAARRHPIDIIVHPGLRQALDIPELARSACRAGAALEINSTHGHLTVAAARQAAKAGCCFALSSDAHRPADVGNLGYAARIARQAGIEPGRIVNAGLCRQGRAGAGWGRNSQPGS